MTLSGSCQCGSVQYTVDGAPLMTYVCHCKDCQKRTGSAFSMGMILPLSAISVSGGLSQWARISDEGNTNTRYSCSICGNIIYGVGSTAPEIAKLQPGTLVNTEDLRVDAHIWTQNAQAWLPLPAEVLKYESQPRNLMEIFEAVTRRRANSTGGVPT